MVEFERVSMKGTDNMAPMVKKAASATILSLLGSTFIMSIAVFLMKDTIDRVNHTIKNVNSHSEQMVGLDGSIILLNTKLDALNTSVTKTSLVLDDYTKNHAKNLSNMTISMVRVTQKLVNLDEKSNDANKDIEECQEKMDKIMDRRWEK